MLAMQRAPPRRSPAAGLPDAACCRRSTGLALRHPNGSAPYYWAMGKNSVAFARSFDGTSFKMQGFNGET